MGAEGMAALAKVLPETQITTLKCAAAERLAETDSARYPHLLAFV